MSSIRTAKDKAAMHAGVICINSQQRCMQQDIPVFTLQKLPKEHAATKLTTVFQISRTVSAVGLQQQSKNVTAAISHHQAGGGRTRPQLLIGTSVARKPASLGSTVRHFSSKRNVAAVMRF